MKQRKSLHILAAMLLALTGSQTKGQTVSIVSDGKAFAIEAQQTQTEVKPGWKIVDIQLKDKYQRYLWGTKAKQLADSNRPQFVVDTDTLLLNDMLLIKLKTKKEYRRIPKPQIHDNTYIRVDLSTFSIDAVGEESFLIRPIQELEPGEYIFTWPTCDTVGELHDWMVWPFSVQ